MSNNIIFVLEVKMLKGFAVYWGSHVCACTKNYIVVLYIHRKARYELVKKKYNLTSAEKDNVILVTQQI
jgi:hypothetical protein